MRYTGGFKVAAVPAGISGVGAPVRLDIHTSLICKIAARTDQKEPGSDDFQKGLLNWNPTKRD